MEAALEEEEEAADRTHARSSISHPSQALFLSLWARVALPTTQEATAPSVPMPAHLAVEQVWRPASGVAEEVYLGLGPRAQVAPRPESSLLRLGARVITPIHSEEVAVEPPTAPQAGSAGGEVEEEAALAQAPGVREDLRSTEELAEVEEETILHLSEVHLYFLAMAAQATQLAELVAPE